MTVAMGTNSYSYDPLYRVTQVAAPGVNNTISYTYDTEGNRLSMTNQDGGVTNYTYDSMNRVTSLTNPQGQVTGYTFDPVGNVLTQTDSNGTTTVRTYNQRNQVVSIQTKNPSGNVLTSSASVYDPAGLLTSITHENGNVISYTYDPDHHLLTETKNTASGSLLYSYAYAYDTIGNRLREIGGPQLREPMRLLKLRQMCHKLMIDMGFCRPGLLIFFCLYFKEYVFRCRFRKRITTHSFRSICATLMFKNGADSRYVQEQLGHKRMSSTERYIRLVPRDLKAIHKKCHPRERKFKQLLN